MLIASALGGLAMSHAPVATAAAPSTFTVPAGSTSPGAVAISASGGTQTLTGNMAGQTISYAWTGAAPTTSISTATYGTTIGTDTGPAGPTANTFATIANDVPQCPAPSAYDTNVACSGLSRQMTVTFSSPVVDPVMAVRLPAIASSPKAYAGSLGVAFDTVNGASPAVGQVTPIDTALVWNAATSTAVPDPLNAQTVGRSFQMHGSVSSIVISFPPYGWIYSGTGTPLAPFAMSTLESVRTQVGIMLPQTDLSVSKTVDRANASAGDTLTWTLNVTDNGSSASHGFLVEDVVPSGVSGVAIASQPAGNACTLSGNSLVCDDAPPGTALADGSGPYKADFSGSVTSSPGTVLDSGATFGPITLTGIAGASTAAQPLTNTATVRASDWDPAVSNNTSSASTALSYLSTVKTLAAVNGSPVTGTPAVKPGDVLTYALTTTNSGTTAGSTTLTETVPAGTSYSGSAEGWSSACGSGASAGTSCTQHQNDVAPGVSAVSLFTVTVDADRAASITNTVASSAQPDCGADCTVVDPLEAWTLAKSVTANGAAASSAKAGDTVQYTVTATNAGTADVPGVVLTDDLSGVLGGAALVPGSVTLANPSSGSPQPIADPSGHTLSTDPFTLAAGTTATLSYSFTVNAGAKGELKNTATGSGDTPPAACAAADDPACTTDTPIAIDLMVQKVGPDASGATVPLDGATFRVLNDDNGQPGTALSGSFSAGGATGLLEWHGLAPGTYWLDETAAPSGYAMLVSPVRFTVARSGAVSIPDASAAPQVTASGTTITVEDSKSSVLPFTGSSPYTAGLVGAGLLGAGLLVALLLARRRRAQNPDD